jgi:hypothetical protein
MSTKKPEFKAIDAAKDPVDLTEVAKGHPIFPEATPIRLYLTERMDGPTITIVMKGHYGLSYGSITVEQINQALKQIGWGIGKCRPATGKDLRMDLDDVRTLAFNESILEVSDQQQEILAQIVVDKFMEKYNILLKDEE